MSKYLNKRNIKLSVVLSSLLIGGMVYMTGCGGGGGGGGGGGEEPNLSICSTPIEASLSTGQIRIGGSTTSVVLHNGWTIYNVANELLATPTDNPMNNVSVEPKLEVEGFIQDIKIVDYNSATYALLAMGDEGIAVVDISDLPTMTIVQDGLKVNYFQDGIDWADGSGQIAYDNNISSTRGPVTSLALYDDGNISTPLQLIIGDAGYGLHKTSLSNVINGTPEGDGTLLIDGEEEYTLQYAGENPWGGPKSLTLHGEGNNTKLFVAQGFLGMGIYDPKTLKQVGRYNLYIDETGDNGGEDWFYDMNVSEVVHQPAIEYLDSCTRMPNDHQAAYEITQYKVNKNIDTPWADFEFYGKYYYDARKIDVVTFDNNTTTAYIAYGNAGLVAVDVTGYADAQARVDCSAENPDFLEGKYLGYVPAIPSHGPEDRIIGKQENQSLFTTAGSGMLKDSGVVDVKVDKTVNQVLYSDHFGGLMVIDYADDPANRWKGDAAPYPNDTNLSVEHVPSYDFVTSYNMNVSSMDDEALPDYTTESPILLTTGEVGGHGNSLALIGNSFDVMNTAPADVVMAAGAGGLNFIDLYGGPAPIQYDFNVTAQLATTSESGADQNGDPTVAVNVGHAAGVGTYDNILYLADGPHGMMAWKVADESCNNIPTDQVRLVGNTLQSEGAVDVNGTLIYPTPHADEVVVINDGINKSALVASLSAGLRRVNINVMGTEGAPALLYPTTGDIYEHSIEETKIAGIDYEDRVYDVAVKGNLAFTADGLSGVTVYNLSATPDLDNNSGFIVGNIKGTGEDRINNATGIALWGNYAFVAGGSTGISVINISDPSNMSIVRSFQPIKWENLEETPMAHNADGVAVAVKVVGNYVFLTYDSYGVLAYNIADLINPDPHPGTEMGRDGRYDAVGHFKLQNDPTFTDWSGGAAGLDSVTVGGQTYIYVAYGDAGAIKIDWTDAANPILVDHANTVGSANDVVVWNGRVYVADGAGGLVLFEE